MLARDLTANTLKRKLRSLVAAELPGFGANGRYLSELGIRTERDGSISLSEADFKKAFSREPIQFYSLKVVCIALSVRAMEVQHH